MSSVVFCDSKHNEKRANEICSEVQEKNLVKLLRKVVGKNCFFQRKWKTGLFCKIVAFCVQNCSAKHAAP